MEETGLSLCAEHLSLYRERQRLTGRPYDSLPQFAPPEPSRFYPNHPPVVYYVKIGEMVKIGTTISLAKRLRDMYTGELLAVEPGSYSRETSRHQMFAAERDGQRELFTFSEALSFHIEAVLTEHGDPWRLVSSLMMVQQ